MRCSLLSVSSLSFALLCFIETGCQYVVIIGLELTVGIMLASNLQKSSCLERLQSAGTTGMHHLS